MTLFGIPNMGNTCFMASVLQLLMSSEKLYQRLKLADNPKKYASYFSNIEFNRSQTIRFFIALFSSYSFSERYNEGDQADAMNFLRMIMDDLPEVFGRFVIDRCRFFKETRNVEEIKYEMSRGDFIFYDQFVNFYPEVIDTVANERKRISPGSYSRETGDVITIDMEYKNFERFFAENMLQEGENDFTVRNYIKLPEELIVNIKRFTYNEYGREVKITKEFFMPEFVYLLEDGKQIPYKLRSFVLHIGSSSSGHYICYRKIQGSWYVCNDEMIEEKNQIPINEGYIYLYEREEEKKIEPIIFEIKKGNDANINEFVNSENLEEYIKTENFSSLLYHNFWEVAEESVKMQTQLGDRIFRSLFFIADRVKFEELKSQHPELPDLPERDVLYSYFLDRTLHWQEELRMERNLDLYVISETFRKTIGYKKIAELI